MSKGVRSSFVRMEEGMKSGETAGIGSILKLSSDKHAGAAMTRPSLRRTFSADMSSRKWLEAQTLKKIPSQHFSSSVNHADHVDYSSSSSEDEEEIEEQRRHKSRIVELINDLERPKQSDIWSCIQSQKAKEAAPVYIHPLVKKSSTSLSQKSLEICTESLGSETGSVDGCWLDFADMGGEEQEREQEEEKTRKAKKRLQLKVIKSPERDFPPPLPSISPSDRSRMQMKSHRKDGRLVVAAVTVPFPVCLRAERLDGRLLLTIVKAPPAHARKTEPQEAVELDPIEKTKKKKTELIDSSSLVMKKLIDVCDIPSVSPRSRSSTSLPINDGGEKLATKTTKTAAMGRPWMLPQLVGSYDSYDTGLKQRTRSAMASPTSARPSMDKYLFGSCKEATARLLMWVPNCIAT